MKTAAHLRVSARLIYLLLIPFSLFSLERQPWLSDVYEFHFLAAYTYSYYDKVNHAVNQLTSQSNDNFLHFGLEFSPTPEWAIDGDLEFMGSPRQSFGFESVALQARYLWLDDIIGDPVSLTTGFNGRYTSNRSLSDVSCPYHGPGDFELNFSIGKEIDAFRYWRYRFWGSGLVGMATRGSPWFYGIVSMEGNYNDQHKWGLFLDGGHGYGRKTTIDINHFNGYGKVRYKYLDLGASYGYRLGVWGTLRAQYIRRLLARTYPENANFFTISYLLPFSF